MREKIDGDLRVRDSLHFEYQSARAITYTYCLQKNLHEQPNSGAIDVSYIFAAKYNMLHLSATLYYWRNAFNIIMYPF